MKIAVDSSILLDIFGADPVFGPSSRSALKQALDRGTLVACDVVWSEVRAHFPDPQSFRKALGLLGVRFEAVSAGASETAGALWKQYCLEHPRKQRSRVIADFLVGGHALVDADALLTRDRGFYRRAFQDLQLIIPSR